MSEARLGQPRGGGGRCGDLLKVQVACDGRACGGDVPLQAALRVRVRLSGGAGWRGKAWHGETKVSASVSDGANGRAC